MKNNSRNKGWSEFTWPWCIHFTRQICAHRANSHYQPLLGRMLQQFIKFLSFVTLMGYEEFQKACNPAPWCCIFGHHNAYSLHILVKKLAHLKHHFRCIAYKSIPWYDFTLKYVLFKFLLSNNIKNVANVNSFQQIF